MFYCLMTTVEWNFLGNRWLHVAICRKTVQKICQKMIRDVAEKLHRVTLLRGRLRARCSHRIGGETRYSGAVTWS